MGEGRGQIFHLGAGGELVALAESPFELEEHFEALIADHPGLLPGDQVDPEDPRREATGGTLLSALARPAPRARRHSTDSIKTATTPRYRLPSGTLGTSR